MTHEDDLTRIKDLLRHTGEFIAYFELAETKMMEWRAEIEQHVARLDQHTQILRHELSAMNDLISEAGTAQFRMVAEKALSQGESNLQLLEHNCNQFTQNFHHQQEKLNRLTERCIEKIEHRAIEATQAVSSQLAQYDVHQFHRLANESCDHIQRVANEAVSKSKKLLGVFQLRFGLFAAFTTIVTAFVIVLYLSDELPWEMHHQAMNERQAGKVLLQAWPNLSQEEKAKILNDEG